MIALPIDPPLFRPALDPKFLPAVLWHRAYRDLAAHDPGAPAKISHLAGGRTFDHEFMGERIQQQMFSLEPCAFPALPAPADGPR